jgi:predicted AAA+ superfamily ATPase
LDTGQLWENYLISERIKRNFYLQKDKSFYFWRTYDGQEIDLIEESEKIISAFEFKLGNKTRKAPHAFSTNYPESDYAVINRDNYLDFILDS